MSQFKHQLMILFIVMISGLTFGSVNAADNWEQDLITKMKQMEIELHKKVLDVEKNKTIFDVKKYGAVGDGKTKCTQAIQKAIDECSKAGGGRVLLARGRYYTGPLYLKNNVNLHIEQGAVIIGSESLEDYPVQNPVYQCFTNTHAKRSLIYAHKVSNISLTGKGCINFNGGGFKGGINNPKRPFGIRIYSCKNVLVKDLYLMNSAQWMQHYVDCDYVLIDNITVNNHCNLNNDGVNIDGSRNAIVSNCRISSHDDGTCVKCTGPKRSENVWFKNNVISTHCNAIKLGTETSGGFKNILITDCQVVKETHAKLMISGSYQTRSALTLIITDGGIMENVLVKNIDSTNCDHPLYITLGNRSRKYHKSAPKPDIGAVRNIKVCNFRSTAAGPIASSITGLNSEYMLKNVTLENIMIECTAPGSIPKIDMVTKIKQAKRGYPSGEKMGRLPAYGLYVHYVNGLTLKNVQFKLSCEDPRPPMIISDSKKIVIDSFTADLTVENPSPLIKFNRVDEVKGLSTLKIGKSVPVKKPTVMIDGK